MRRVSEVGTTNAYIVGMGAVRATRDGCSAVLVAAWAVACTSLAGCGEESKGERSEPGVQ